MKRWWNKPGYSASARVARRRASRILMGVTMAGAVGLPIAKADITINFCVRIPFYGDYCYPVTIPTTSFSTGGAVVDAWAFGTLSSATHPNSQEACDLEHVCELAISSPGGAGTGTGATIKMSFQPPSQVQPPSNLAFGLTEAIDYGRPVTKGVRGASGGGACYPASGVLAIAADPSSILVLDIVGQACQAGNNTTQLVFSGNYVTDAASSGTFANVDGIGTLSINTPSGLPGTGTGMKASLQGQLLYGN
jgi:hypothetical protein